MAQDVRPYKSKEQDGQGNEIILRDQQLVEQTSQTTMASGEYFEIVDVDGRMAKIPKDNMIGVVREALGILLNGLADQTTVAKFLTLNGNTLGASAAATAASVLGGQGMLGLASITGATLDFSQSIESLKAGVYANTTSNPDGVLALLALYAKSNLGGQYFNFVIGFEADEKKLKSMYYRIYRASWGNWHKVSATELT